MSSRAGTRPAGTDGTDFLHRQRVAAHYKESAHNKFLLKMIFGAHFLILICMWAKVGSEVLREYFGVDIAFVTKLNLPQANPWEYVWCFSFIAILLGLLSFPRNKVAMIDSHYYAQFFLGIVPCVIGLGSQLPEILHYFSEDDSQTPTMKGSFPIFFIWYVFFVIALQIHMFSMYIAYQLSTAWAPLKKTE